MAETIDANSGRVKLSGEDVKSGQPTLDRQHHFLASQCRETLGDASIDDVGVIEWLIDNLSARPVTTKTFSEPFSVGGRTWKVELRKEANDNPDLTAMGIFLHSGGDSGQDWTVDVNFSVALSNPSHPTVFHLAHAKHMCVWACVKLNMTAFAVSSAIGAGEASQRITSCTMPCSVGRSRSCTTTRCS